MMTKLFDLCMCKFEAFIISNTSKLNRLVICLNANYNELGILNKLVTSEKRRAWGDFYFKISNTLILIENLSIFFNKE